MEGPINDVLICTLTDNVTKRLFQRALWTKTSGFLPGDYQGANPAGVKVVLYEELVAQVRETSEGIGCPLDPVKDGIEVHVLEAKHRNNHGY